MDSMELFTHLLTMLNEVYRYTRCHKFVYIQHTMAFIQRLVQEIKILPALHRPRKRGQIIIRNRYNIHKTLIKFKL